MESKSNNIQKPRNIQGKTKGRVENLKPQKAGEPSHNPNGRPKGLRNRSTIVREWLETIYSKTNPISGKTESLSIQDHMVISLIGKALKGDVQAFKELMDSGHGKIPDKLLAENKNTFQSDLTQEESRKIINRLKSELDTNNG
jgi:hypothetical protein